MLDFGIVEYEKRTSKNRYDQIIERVMVYNATFNNISVLLVDLVGVSGENKPTCCKSLTLPHNVISSTPRHRRDSNSQR